MPLLSIEDAHMRFRGPSLLDGVTARIESGQKIGLLGRNGAGKTTLLKLIAGDHVPDAGSITLSPGAKVRRLVQDVPGDLTGSVRNVVIEPGNGDEAWQREHAADSTISRMELDPDARFESLSSGMKRRVLLARAIASAPDLLLLDEPTNHLDLESILWLEGFLKAWKGTLLFITHDRSFLQNLANRIWEIDRGRLFDWSCDYQTFLKRKEAALEAEEKQNALFDKKLAQEEAWIRQGIKARRTRNEGRVRALKKLRVERAERRTAEGTARLAIQQAERSGALVADVQSISFAYPDKPILSDFSTTIMRGDKIGIIGPNGAGKTTLLKLLLGRMEPDAGNVKLGTKLQIAYFDQLRDTLDPEKTVADNVGEGSDRVKIGELDKHIYGYLQEFLFPPERARTQVKFLSGGERNRALLAKLMTRGANLIVLDEPTNDLDAETLEMLEEQLIEFAGTILMVSHDRTFLNNVVTSTIVFEGDDVAEYDGGYDDWKAAVGRRVPSDAPEVKSPAQTPRAKPKTEAKKLSYKDQRELESLPQKIESLEVEIAAMHEAMADPAYYQSEPGKITADAESLKQLENDLAAAYERWEFLEG